MASLRHKAPQTCFDEEVWSPRSGQKKGAFVRHRLLLVGLVTAVAAAAALSPTSPAGGVAGFGDVPAGVYYTEAVQWMVDNEITTGTSAHCFSPDDPVSRGQAAAFMWRMEGAQDAPPHPFSDVARDYQQEPVSWMYDQGITTGTTATTFSPEDSLTRGQLAALLWRLAGEPDAPPHPFNDVVRSYQQEPVSWMAAAEPPITNGTSAVTFSPDEFVTRGQLAAFFWRYKGEPAVSVDPGGAPCRIASDGTPSFPGDFADPSLLRVRNSIYAYATNAFFVNVPTLLARTNGTSRELGDSLPNLPEWSEPGFVWAPSVTAVGDTYVMHYTTRHSSSGRQCISVAVSDSPAGPFVDDSDEPLVCALGLGGSIDPDVIDDDGDLWLLWKSDGNCCGLPTIIFVQPLSADGTELAGDAVELIRNDRAWERDVVEAPAMIKADGAFHLFYSANRWDSDQYAVGYAVCDAVTGPCTKDPEPWLTDTEGTSGPGGLDVIHFNSDTDLVAYHGWSGDNVGYDRGQRSIYARFLRWVDGRPVFVDSFTDE